MLDAYDRERCFAADENILNSSRTTRFMTPHDGIERLFRDQVLDLASRAEFARPMVNSGRLSRPCVYPLAGAPDDPALPAVARPGSVAPDAPLGNGWLIDALGREPILLSLGGKAPAIDGLPTLAPPVNDHIRNRYLGDAAQAIYLVRPDQVIAARWRNATPAAIAEAAAALWREDTRP